MSFNRWYKNSIDVRLDGNEPALWLTGYILSAQVFINVRGCPASRGDSIYHRAALMGGMVAGTRVAVEEGWISQQRQVGQTGQSVRPEVYIACGISGAIQHRAGMQESQRIIAINTDPNAPIFAVAHYGIVGDLHEAIPKMIKAYKEKD